MANKWLRAQFKNIKPHFSNKELIYDLLEENQISLNVDDVDLEPANEGLIDLPGMILANRTYQTIKIQEFKLMIPTTDFKHFHNKLDAAPIRKFKSGNEYYKLHGWMACVMLDKEHGDSLKSVMYQMLPEIEMQAEDELVKLQKGISSFNDWQKEKINKLNN